MRGSSELGLKTESLGGSSEAAPPVPIPNTAVKRFSADDTALVTVWDNRPLPGGFFFGPDSEAVLQSLRGVGGEEQRTDPQGS